MRAHLGKVVDQTVARMGKPRMMQVCIESMLRSSKLVSSLENLEVCFFHKNQYIRIIILHSSIKNYPF
jgi:hypothetical protein